MASFESPIGNRKVTGNKLREFDIPDGEDENQFNIDQAIASGNMKKLDVEEIRQFQQRLDGVSFEQEEDLSPKEELRIIEDARRNRRKGIERLSQGAKKRIEMLIGMTRSVRPVVIDNTEYVLQTLKSQEMRDALLSSSKYEHTVEFAFEIRLQFLARSLMKIGGIDLDQFLGDPSFEAKLLFINELDEHLLNRLYNEYSSLAKGATERYSVRTPEDAEGVVADLKK